MTLVKTSLLNAIAVAAKILTLLGINKILAVYVGPAGYAAIGQLQNIIQMIMTLASGAINTGVTKYTAEFAENDTKLHTLWKTAGTISVIGALSTGLIISILSKFLATWLMKSTEFSSIFIWLGCTLIFLSLNALMLAILNGKKQVKLYVIANVMGSFFALVVTGILTAYWSLYGALVALVIYQSLTFFITSYLCIRSSWFDYSMLFGSIDKTTTLNLLKFAAMAITSAIVVPTSHIFIRDLLGQRINWQAAGYWEAMWRLSSAYLILVTTTLSVYYLPRFSEIAEKSELRREVLNGYKIIVPTSVVVAVTVFLSRGFIIRILFTSDFQPMQNLFAWQMIGDTFKICSWLIGYLFAAKAMYKLHIFSEIFFASFFYSAIYLLLPRYGLQATAIAHAITYTCHFIFIFSSLRIREVI